MELCNELDRGKRFGHKELNQKVCEKCKSNPQGERLGGGMTSRERSLASDSHGVRARIFLGWGRREAIAASVLCCHGPGDLESPGILGEEQI